MNTKPISLHEEIQALWTKCTEAGVNVEFVASRPVDREWWTGNSGNAKARRRWRRRDIPNRQRTEAAEELQRRSDAIGAYGDRQRASPWKIEGNSIIGPRLSEVVP